MLTSPLLSVPHGFSTRDDGDPREPEPAARIVARLHGDGPLCMVQQVHGATVVLDTEVSATTEADAIVCTTPGRVVGVRVADCVPILLQAPGAVAAVHAGWRGTAAGVTAAALAVLCEEANVKASEVRAVIGPHICVSCYEVGDEVRDALRAVIPGVGWQAGRHVDLGRANAAVLEAAGVTVAQPGLCTRCDLRFWSHRREGASAGRQIGAIRC